MKSKSIFIVLITMLFFIEACGQSNSNESKSLEFFKSYSNSKNKSFRIVKNINLNKIDIDDLVFNKFKISKVITNIDYNFDKKLDLIVLMNKDNDSDKKINIKDPSQDVYRVVLFCEGKSDSLFYLEKRLNKLLNQNTEGMLHGFFNLIIKDNNMTFREAGNQVGIEWSTDLVFSYDTEIKDWLLKKAIINSANLSSDGIEIKKSIKLIKSTEKVNLNKANYYNYFPFGFSDEIPSE